MDTRAMEAAWELAHERFAAYELVLPGNATFACLTTACPSHCCRIYSVSLGEGEVERMRRASGLEPVMFLEHEEGEVIRLPLAQPYLLARREGACALLGPAMLCGQYEGRPNACRLYPHFVLVVERETGRPQHCELDEIHRLVAASVAGTPDAGPLVPLLLRHLDCPGFGGPPLADDGWQALFHETTALQYPLEV